MIVSNDLFVVQIPSRLLVPDLGNLYHMKDSIS